MENFLFPKKALESDLLWTVCSGPNQGQALPVIPGIFGRVSGLDDLAISRNNLNIYRHKNTLRAAPLPGSAPVYKVWKTLRFRSRLHHFVSLRPGRCLQLGHSRLRVVKRPHDLRIQAPPPPARGNKRWLLFLVLPLLFMVGLGSFIGLRILFLFGIALLAGIIWLCRRANTTPSPVSLWLGAAAPRQSTSSNPGDKKGLRVFTSRRWWRRTLDLAAGENLCLTGPYAEVMARWIAAQVLIFGQGHLSPSNPPPWKSTGKGLREDSLELVITTDTTLPQSSPNRVVLGIFSVAPPWAQRILPVKRFPYAVQESWFSSLLSALEEQPRTLDLAPLAAGEELPQIVKPSLFGSVDTATIQRNWDECASGLHTVLGMCDAGKAWHLDLVAEGPHALVAGTTGAGKSELLTSWLIGLALRYPPTAFRLILVDYKGGAAFGPLRRLPHTHGVLTDLCPNETSRALLSLEAFLRLREQTLARVHARDVNHYASLTGVILPRLAIVVDEFRAVASDHPETLENLIRLATHGRSLGLHLILATQKPGGVVSGQIMANANLRLALRMRSPLDSNEILGDSRAASLPPIPGRLFWEGNTSGVAQAIWCGGEDWVERTVETIRQTWAQTGKQTELAPLWCPPLPDTIDAPAGGWALVDEPHSGTQRWEMPASTLGIFGNPGTGKTTALETLACEVVRLHSNKDEATSREAVPPLIVVSPSPERFTPWCQACSPAGFSCTPGDLWELDRLATLACSKRLSGATLLLDEADLVVEALERISPGRGAKRLESLISNTRQGGYRLAFTASLAAGRGSWGTLSAERYVLCPRDTVDLHTAGIEPLGKRHSLSEVLPDTITPGRGVWQFSRGIRQAQIGLATPPPPCLEPPREASLLHHLPKQLSSAEVAHREGLVTIGYSSTLGDWLSLSPQRLWTVENKEIFRGLVAQIKREYRRLGFTITDAATFEPEQMEGPTLLFMDISEHNDPNLKTSWDYFERDLKFDLTILERVSPGLLPQILTKLPPPFAIHRTNIVSLDSSLEARHRTAALLQTDTENLRKLHVTTYFPAVYQDGNDVGALLFPHENVTHLT